MRSWLPWLMLLLIFSPFVIGCSSKLSEDEAARQEAGQQDEEEYGAGDEDTGGREG